MVQLWKYVVTCEKYRKVKFTYLLYYTCKFDAAIKEKQDLILNMLWGKRYQFSVCNAKVRKIFELFWYWMWWLIKHQVVATQQYFVVLWWFWQVNCALLFFFSILVIKIKMKLVFFNRAKDNIFLGTNIQVG